MAEKPASPPACFPIGVRAAETMTEPGMARSLCRGEAFDSKRVGAPDENWLPQTREAEVFALGDTGYRPRQHKSVKHLIDISSRPGGNISSCRRSWTPS